MRLLANLIKKDILLELRQRHIFMGLLLYVTSTVFVVFLMNGQPEAKMWNALFWLVQLFVSINAVAKGFLQERRDRFRYYFQLVPPHYFILGKIVYNGLLQLVLSLVSFGLFSFLLGSPQIDTKIFLLISILGSLSLSTTFTFLSAVAASAQQGAGLVAVLGFPLVLPLLMILNKLLNTYVSGAVLENKLGLYFVLCLMTLLVGVLSWILYPVLWKE